MKATLFTVFVLLAGLVSGQGTLPMCAQSCVTQFTTGTNIGNCGNLDIACICSSKSFLNDIACCLATHCNAADQAASVAYAKSVCQTAGVNVPDAVVCSSATASATAAKNAGPQNTAGVGMGLAGGIVGVLALL